MLHKDFPIKTRFRGKQRIIDWINRNNANKKINVGDYDIIHSTLYEPYIIKKAKNPVVITVHDMIHEIFPEYFGVNDNYSIKKKVMIMEADKINVDSKTTKDDILKFFPEVEKKISVIYLGCSLKVLDTYKEKGDYILFTGQRGGYKNFINFIEAVAPLLCKYNLRLLCTGNPFSQNETALLKERGIEGKVSCIFAAEREIEDLYATAIIFVFPSLYEGFWIPLLEAFSVGCPVIASNGGALPEIGGDAAVYFDPNSVDNMRSTIENVLLSPSLQKELVIKGREQVKKFSWDRCVKETVQVYESLKRNS